MLAKILNLVKKYQSDIVLAVCIVMLTVIGFNLGKLSVVSSSSMKSLSNTGQDMAGIYKPTVSSNPKTTIHHTDLSVVASKKSKSKYYHFSWCPGAKQISDANKLTFATEAEAIAAGYHLATNCVR